MAVLSDHGESLGEHGEFSHGVFLYDSTLRIAFLLSGPGVPSGLRVTQQARTIDLLPTILDLLGGSVAGRQSKASAWFRSSRGKDAATAISYAETLYPKINLGWAELRGIRTNQWKYIRAPKPELYDLSRDPGETNNVLAEHPTEVRKMEAQLAAASHSTGPEKVETTPMDERTLAQLKSLGYTAGVHFALLQSRRPGSRSQGSRGDSEADGRRRTTAVRAFREPRRIALLQQAVRVDPTNPLLYYPSARNWRRPGRYDQAMTLYRTALEKGTRQGTDGCTRAWAICWCARERKRKRSPSMRSPSK